MKGIILAGGSGTRLYPLTMVMCKQLLPIYDKPMIFYPLSTLMLAGIKDILLISTKEDMPNFKKLLDDGHQYGIRISYKEQPSPDGIAQAFLLGEDFLEGDSCALILGDNIFYGTRFSDLLGKAVKDAENGVASIFGYYVNDPERFGIVEFDQKHKVISIEEKPKKPKSNYCVTGLYFYDNRVVELAKQLTPSERGELEITDLNNLYLKADALNVHLLGRGFSWIDMGTMDSLVEAATFVHMMQKRQNVEISAPEEIAYRKGWINRKQLLQAAERFGKSSYGQYLSSIAMGEEA
jgi:Glucose-1-phosphate thymidylyltransferase (EC 2.7.7.24)